MTFHSPITAASPLALATALRPPFIDRPTASAVVSIQKALEQLPREVRDGTLEEIGTATRPRDLLRQRMETAAEIDGTPDWDLDENPEHIALWSRFLGLEKQILALRPTPESIVSKFTLLARISVEGNRVGDEDYLPLVAEAEQVLQAMPADSSLTNGDGAAGAVRPQFLARRERWRRLSEAHRAYEGAHLEAARARFDAAVAKIPHATADLGESVSGRRIVHTTAEKWHVDFARRFVADPAGDTEGEYAAGHRKIAEAADERERLIAEARQASGFGKVRERSNRFGGVVAQAEWSFVRMPVATAAELELKIAFMIENDLFDCDDAPAALLADARALKCTGGAPASSVAHVERDRLLAQLRENGRECERLSANRDEAEGRYLDVRPPVPVAPAVDVPNIENMTFAEVRASGALGVGPAWTEYERQWAEHRERDEAVRVSSGLAEAETALDEAMDRRTELLDAILSYPAIDHAFVCDKLRLIRAEFGTPDESEMGHLLADVERLGASGLVH